MVQTGTMVETGSSVETGTMIPTRIAAPSKMGAAESLYMQYMRREDAVTSDIGEGKKPLDAACRPAARDDAFFSSDESALDEASLGAAYLKRQLRTLEKQYKLDKKELERAYLQRRLRLTKAIQAAAE
jgi:hypothetical protein